MYDIEGYGRAEYVDFNPDLSDLRRSRSWMPTNYVYQHLDGFRWEYYAEDTKKLQELTDLFVAGYQEWRKQGRGLYIWSQAKGSGKTMLACCLANEVIDKFSAVVKFINATDFVKLIASKDSESIKALYNCGLMIFDDIGAEDSKKDWILENVYRLINHRYSNNLPTIFTSNNSYYQTHKDDRIHSRIFGASIELRLPDSNIREAMSLKTQNTFLSELAQNYQKGAPND